LHAVGQLAGVRQAQAEGAARIRLGLTLNLERRIATFLGVAVTLIALIADAGERLDADVATTEVVADFGKGVLGAGVIALLSRSLKPLNATRRLPLPSWLPYEAPRRKANGPS
jgi:hypothetical protein